MSESSILSLLGKIAEEVGRSEETARAEIEYWKGQAEKRVDRDDHNNQCSTAALLGFLVGFILAATLILGSIKILGG